MLEGLMSQAPSSRGAWQEEASCKDKDPTLWTLTEDKELNKKNFEIAEVICSTCAVFAECWKSATDVDRLVTMRSGAWPEEYRPPKIDKMKFARCKNDHDTSSPESRLRNGKCKACRDEKIQLALLAKVS